MQADFDGRPQQGWQTCVTYAQDSYPRMQLTCSDLSPFYLAAAWENQEYWQRMRQPALTPENQTNFLQTAAENIAAADDSYDVVCAFIRSSHCSQG